jgi:UDP-N-acetylmuramate dehydrogenase
MMTGDVVLREQVEGFLARVEGQVRGKILAGHALSRLTTFHIGGPASVVAVPHSREELDHIRDTAAACGLPLKVLGRGSNILAADRGYRGVILLVVARGINDANVNKGIVEVEAGVALNRLVLWSVDQGLAGLEQLVGIPGTLGGAIVNNAGALGLEISHSLRKVLFFEEEKGWRWRERNEMGFSYRSSRIDGIIYKAQLELEAGDREQLTDECRRNQGWRRAAQPLTRHSAGSVFKNGEGYRAGEVIDRCGCKGWRVGDALVSEKHANFIVNTGNARAWQVLELIEKVQERVYAREGIELELEIELLGDFAPADEKAKVI